MTFYKDLVTLETEICKLLEDGTDPKVIAKYLSYVATGSIYSEYNNDLELMLKLDCSFKENYGLTNLLLKMIPEMKIPQPEPDPFIIPIPSFNLTFKNQKQLHPTIDWLYSRLFSFHHGKSNIILDLYVDETFGLNCEIYKLLNIVPYTNKWYGFVYEIDNLFGSQVFLDSLYHCRGLFVFSQDLKGKLESKLGSLNINVSLFCFPVEEPKQKFNGNVRNIVSGNSSETTDIFSFYKTNFKLKETFWFRKANTRTLHKYVLSPNKGLNTMDINVLKTTLNTTLGLTQWNMGLISHIYRLIDSVCEVVHYDIDEMLSCGIVFCNVISGSVIRLLNECIVRNTPVIVNKHPITLELLGPDYPLYIDNCCEIIITISQIKKAHKYLKKMNKTKYSMNTFLCTLNSKIVD